MLLKRIGDGRCLWISWKKEKILTVPHQNHKLEKAEWVRNMICCVLLKFFLGYVQILIIFSRGKWCVLGHGSLHLRSLHFAILEGHVWASIEGERVLWRNDTQTSLWRCLWFDRSLLFFYKQLWRHKEYYDVMILKKWFWCCLCSINLRLNTILGT